MTAPLFSKGALPDGDFGEFRKTSITTAIRMCGPFSCRTSEGNVASCEDGWLAVDSHGHPYPINAAEFEEIYAEVELAPTVVGRYD